MLQGESVTYDSSYEQADGKFNWYQVNLNPVVDESGQVIHILIGIENITVRKEAEARLAKQRDLFKELSFITSHELRHEYAKLHSIIDLLSHSPSIDPEIRHILDDSNEIFENLNQSIAKINNRINFSHSEILSHVQVAKNIRQIILMDDDSMTNYLNRKLIEKVWPELEIHVFSRPDKVLEALDSLNLEQALLFLDLNMPSLSGWDILNHLKEQYPSLPVVILSSSIDKRDRKKARDYAQVINFITKPLNKEILQQLKETFEMVTK